jgi:hypothetical protein
MTMTGIFRIALLPNADEKKFVDHMVGSVFDTLQLTRVTRGFAHSLLKGEFRQYAWLVTVDLVGDGNYDFNQNRERVEQSIAGFGLLLAIEAYTNVPTKSTEE